MNSIVSKSFTRTDATLGKLALAVPLFLTPFALAQAADCSALSSSPIYQVVNPASQANLLTATQSEASNAISKHGFTQDKGTPFYASKNPASGLVGAHRMYNAQKNDFFWTVSSSEVTSAVNKYGYADQGINFYVVPPDNPNGCAQARPVRRFQLGNMHRFAVSQADQDALRASGWKDEGIMFYGGAAPDQAGAASDPEPVIDKTGVRNASAGALPIGQANYKDYPPNAIFVSPTGSDATGSGTVAAPYAKIQTAIDQAPVGGTIVLRAGTYHESIATARKVTIQSYPFEAVWLDGSVVITDWAPSGLKWFTPWNHKFSHDPTFTAGAEDGTATGYQFVNLQYPMAPYPDQVWIDGVAQTQVASLGEVTQGTFFYDENAALLYLGSNPAGHVVRASDLQVAITDRSTGSVFRGFGVRRYAPSVPDMGAVRLYEPGSGTTFENMAIIDNATTGLFIGGTDARVTNVTVARNGLEGVGGNRSDGLRMTGLLAAENNQEHFNIAPVSGGFKTARSHDVVVQDSVFLNNLGAGLWFDQSSYDMRIVSNDAIGNIGNGITVEISDKATLANNLVVDNGGAGIKVDNTSNVAVWNNTIANNGVNTIAATDWGYIKGETDRRNLSIAQEDRRWATGSASDRDAVNGQPRPPLLPNQMTWIVSQTDIHNNAIGMNAIVGTGNNCLVCVQDVSTDPATVKIPAEEMIKSTDNNVYQMPSPLPNPPGTKVWWGFAIWSLGPGDPATPWTLSDFSAATGQEANSWASGNPIFGAGYRLIATGNAKAKSLPQDIADLIGKPADALQLGVWW